MIDNEELKKIKDVPRILEWFSALAETLTTADSIRSPHEIGRLIEQALTSEDYRSPPKPALDDDPGVTGRVRLYTRCYQQTGMPRSEFVAEVETPPFLEPPEVLTWGSRTFQRAHMAPYDPDGMPHYYEVFAFVSFTPSPGLPFSGKGTQ